MNLHAVNPIELDINPNYYAIMYIKDGEKKLYEQSFWTEDQIDELIQDVCLEHKVKKSDVFVVQVDQIIVKEIKW